MINYHISNPREEVKQLTLLYYPCLAVEAVAVTVDMIQTQMQTWMTRVILIVPATRPVKNVY